jgi:hypothetical protein
MEATIIILDINQVMLSNLMMQMGSHTNMKIEEDLVRHMVLNSIRMYNNKFREEFGDEMVVACDNKHYWRRDVYPYYKANRKKARDATDLDWNAIFDCMKKIRSELSEYFPYRVVNADGAEADDVIATLVEKHADDFSTPILILSGDKDFIQLQQYRNVKQYDPVRKKFITHNDPVMYIKEHIIKGDAGDGIPNFLSPDNCLVVGIRQKPITSKKLEAWLRMMPEQFGDETMLRNFKRNQQLIDLSFIPTEVKERVINEYDAQSNKDRSKLFNYFATHKLKNLMENINEF